MLPDFPWYAFAFAGALVVAVTAIVEKRVVSQHEPVELSESVALIAAAISLPLLYFVKWQALTGETLAFVFVIAFLTACAFSLSMMALRRLDAGELSPILALTPAATALVAVAALGEVLAVSDAIGIAVVIAGLISLEVPALLSLRKVSRTQRLAAVTLGLLAVVVYALSATVERLVLSAGHLRPFDFIVLAQVFMAVPFSLYALSARRGLFKPLRENPGAVLGIALLLFGARVLHAQAVSMAYVALASALKRTSALFTVILAGIFLKEKGTARKLVSLAIILAGVFLIIF